VPETWTRPYEPGAGRWLVIAWEAVALAMLGWSSIRKFDLTETGVWIMIGVMAALWIIGAWRIVRMGVYAGADGVRIRGLLRSRTLRWHEVAHVHLHKATHHLGPWEIESGLTVLIERRDGSMVNTELWAQGVDFHSRPRLFRAVYHELRTLHLDALAG
jgi:Bacterial PH domain